MRAALAAAVGALALTGCAMAPLAPPEATLDNIQAIRAAGLSPIKVGSFTPGPGAPTEMDKVIDVRAGEQRPPGGSFARFLGDTLAAELKGAGKFDPNSRWEVSGVVTNTHVDSSIPTARAALAAHFTLTRDGAVVFDKTLSATSTWNSEIIGAVAIPDALNHYMALYPKLVTILVADPEFRAAAKSN